MNKITPEDIDLLSKEVPGFMGSIEKAKQEKADFMLMSVHAFTPEKETTLLKTCLQYAREHDVTLVFKPGHVTR